MPRRAATITQADVTRAVKGVLAAGEKVQRVEIMPDGSVVVFTGKPAEAAPVADTTAANEWDTVQ
jgi:hypothetical protein